MTRIPFFVFWALLFLARKELGWRWVLICVGIWAALLAGFMYAGIQPGVFITAESLLDIVLILVIFKGDIRIN